MRKVKLQDDKNASNVTNRVPLSKRLSTAILLGIILLPLLYQIGIMVNFEVNQDFIAKNLCINRKEPVNNCHGKCYLTKQLKKSKDSVKDISRIKEVVLSNPMQNQISKQILFEDLYKNHFFTETNKYVSSFVSVIFRPPILSLS